MATFNSQVSKLIVALFVFICLTSMVNHNRIDPSGIDDEILENLVCNRRNSSHNRSSEGSHYPNQTFYEEIISKEPEFWVVHKPRISSSTRIVVLSITNNIDYGIRDQIRMSWANRNIPPIQKGRVATIFLVGNDEEDLGCLTQEQREHGDLLIVKMRDSYRGLVYKLLMAYRYISKHFPNAHLVKIDRDVMTDVEQMEYLFATQTSPYLLMGHVYTDISVSRNESHPFFVPTSVYSPSWHPWYMNGCFYILSAKSLAAIVAATPGARVIEIEDIFFTGILRSRANLAAMCLPNFYMYPQQYTGCSSESHRRMIGFWIGGDIEVKHRRWMEFKRNPCNRSQNSERQH